MNKWSALTGGFLLAITTVFAAPVYSKEFVVSYDGFYDRLKVVNKGDFQYAQVNFYVTDIATNDVCKIKTGKIVTEKQTFPLTYTERGQLLLPYDKQLDTDKAVIVIEPHNPVHDCQLKLQIEATQLDDFALSKANLYILNQEFADLLSDLSGFFVGKLMWFLLPNQQGVILHFTDDNRLQQSEHVQCKLSRCLITVVDDWQHDNTLVTSTTGLIRATPWIVK
ncbi:DUF2987 domain-containing protein [Pseudoalteromonas mariniglutinosa]|uniref:DUF2987 domain-containing protein n=1 Tax=Pseudoalteromonas mariniglutinosa TaxID=206042 RepID=UPI00384B349F